MAAIYAQKNGYPRSSIYAPLVVEANRIARTKADLKAVIAYTDACENTSVFSIYDPIDRNLLMHHPEKVQELLAQYGKVDDLHGVTIYIIHSPLNDMDNENFSIMSRFYKSLFEDAGAKVCIGANVDME